VTALVCVKDRTTVESSVGDGAGLCEKPYKIGEFGAWRRWFVWRIVQNRRVRCV